MSALRGSITGLNVLQLIGFDHVLVKDKDGGNKYEVIDVNDPRAVGPWLRDKMVGSQ